MNRKLLPALALILAGAAAVTTGASAAESEFAGPGPRVTGNNIGGIFPYRPAPPEVYRQIAESFCARYGRLGKVTSVPRAYGDYVAFVCYDRPGMIH